MCHRSSKPSKPAVNALIGSKRTSLVLNVDHFVQYYKVGSTQSNQSVGMASSLNQLDCINLTLESDSVEHLTLAISKAAAGIHHSIYIGAFLR